MNLVLDIGNTRTKAALFEQRNLLENYIFDKNPLPKIKKLLAQHPQIKFSIVSSVLNHSKELSNALQHKTNCIDFNSSIRLPLLLNYATPETLGKDRIAAAVGAYALYKDKNVLSIDAGTCLKFDLVTEKGQYEGGSISPGLEMRLKALNRFTDKLPLLNADNNYGALTGKSTTESILSGVQNGMLYEIQGFINAYKQQYPGIVIVLTGGDMPFFEVALKSSIFANPNLVLFGLNEILNFNVL